MLKNRVKKKWEKQRGKMSQNISNCKNVSLKKIDMRMVSYFLISKK